VTIQIKSDRLDFDRKLCQLEGILALATKDIASLINVKEASFAETMQFSRHFQHYQVNDPDAADEILSVIIRDIKQNDYRLLYKGGKLLWEKP